MVPEEVAALYCQDLCPSPLGRFGHSTGRFRAHCKIAKYLCHQTRAHTQLRSHTRSTEESLQYRLLTPSTNLFHRELSAMESSKIPVKLVKVTRVLGRTGA